MISPELLECVACPLCLEATGCRHCGQPQPTTAAQPAEYARRAACACGGPDKPRLHVAGDTLRCPSCAASYPLHHEHGFVDLAPRSAVGAVTQYADHEFFERLNVTDAPPVLSARVKADMMRRMLAPGPGERVLDLGSGAGKFALYTAATGAHTTGVDLAPFFLARATRDIALVLGDLRRLPFRKGSFPRAYTLDVLEHLDEGGVREVLLEARRVLGPGGRLFVYTHAMESSRLAQFQRLVNRLAKRLGRAGLIDHEREALRKSDHRNAIRSHEHFDALCAEAGLSVRERRYYNVVFKAVIEDLLLRLVEQWRRGRKSPSEAPADAHAHAAGETHAASAESGLGPRTVGGQPPGRLALAIAQGLTWLLKLDVVLFGGIRTGPFFGLLEVRDAPASGASNTQGQPT
jgi:ubiquinone/menaquinone biosynthesis C-methylase UbiE